MNYLEQAQEFILNNTKKEYYKSAYKKAELLYWELIYQWFVDNDIKIESCLDIGCAYGTWLSIVKHKYCNTSLYGIDFRDDIISHDIIKKLDLDFKVCNIQIESMPFTNKFDLIILTEVLEHFNFNCISTIDKMVESMNDGGYLFFSTPNYYKQPKIQTYKSYKEMPSIGSKYEDKHIYIFKPEEVEEIFVKIMNLKPILFETNKFGHINGIFQK